MTGLQRVQAVLAGEKPDRTPIVPIVHSGLARMFGVPLGRFFTDAQVMAETIIRGYRTFGYDGVQLSLGVTAEPEALGARVRQPADGAPVLQERLLEDPANLNRLRDIDVLERGRFPMFRRAVERVVETIGKDALVVVTLRGPFLMAAQLRGVERVLMDTLTSPGLLAEVLDFTGEITLKCGLAFRETGAHAVVLGEATCSPNFIPPATYRSLVLDHHRRVVGELCQAGWSAVGVHICGNILPIFEDVLSTGVNLVDIDHQVSPAQVLKANRARAVLRGNLDPSAVFAFGTPEVIDRSTRELRRAVEGQGSWIYSSGCDISPGTPRENLERVVKALAAG